MRRKGKHAKNLGAIFKSRQKINGTSGKNNPQQQHFIVAADWKRVMVYRVKKSPVVPDQRILKAWETWDIIHQSNKDQNIVTLQPGDILYDLFFLILPVW